MTDENHDPLQCVTQLRQTLSADKLSIGFFLGAGCPCAVRIPNEGGDVVANIAVLRSLAEQGFVLADRLGLGIAVDEIGRPIGSDGVVRSDLFVAGPLARERYGELMGLPQVAVQPDSVASDIANELAFLRKAAQ